MPCSGVPPEEEVVLEEERAGAVEGLIEALPRSPSEDFEQGCLRDEEGGLETVGDPFLEDVAQIGDLIDEGLENSGEGQTLATEGGSG